MSKGDQFCVGVVNGPRGKARIIKDDASGLEFEIQWDTEVLKPMPITLIVGLPRPQAGRRILEECTTVGVGRIFFFGAEKGELSYMSSKLWQTDEWKRHLMKGAEQAFNTTIPEVMHFQDLASCLNFLERKEGRESFSVALDNYEAPLSMQETLGVHDAYTVAVGGERGWSSRERNLLRASDFALAHLGDRVLRVETACVAALISVALILGKI